MSFFSSHPTSSLSSHPKPWAALAPSGGFLSSPVTLVVAAVGPLRAPETDARSGHIQPHGPVAGGRCPAVREKNLK